MTGSGVATFDAQRSIRADFVFMDPAATDGVVDDADPRNTRLATCSREVTISDLRGREDSVSLQRNGLAVLHCPTACRNPRDEAELQTVYYPEIEALVARLTGASLVRAYGHVVRASREDGTPGLRLPARMAHVDNDFGTTRQLAARLAPADRREALMQGRFMLINLWRPLRTVQRHPLAVVDGSTVRRCDLVPVRLLASRSGVNQPHGLNMIHHADQRWHYLSHMQPDELLAFRQIDACSDAVQFAGHTAFDDPTTAPDAPARESIEIRTVSYLPW